MPLVGRLAATGDPFEPYRLLGPDGAAVDAVSAFFVDLQAAGRSEATLRSYGMDLLRWFRFLWALGVPLGPGDAGRGAGLQPLVAGRRQTGPARIGVAGTRPAASRSAARGASATPPRCAPTARRCCAASTSSTVRPAPGRS